MTQYLDKLIQQTHKLIPEFSNALQRIPQNKLYLNYPLELANQKFQCTFPNSSTFLKSQKTIRPNNHILLLESNQFFASSNFVGATSLEQDDLNNKLRELKSKYQIFDDDMIARIKLTLSVQANSLDQNMQLNTYSKYIVKLRKNQGIENYIKTYSNSGFLKSVLNSNRLAVTTAYQYLNKSFMRTLRLDDFTSAYEMVRYFSKETNKIRVIFPFSNNIKHSFQPNCQLKAMFLTHRRQNFLTLSSIKQIGPGQQLSLNYGNQNNYELFVRYGFAVPNNPFSQFYLPLDYSQIDQIFNANIEWKMDMFKKNKNLKLKNFIKLNSEGKINSQDLNMLKIVFSTIPLTPEQFKTQTQLSKNMQIQIYEFVRNTAERFTQMMQQMIEKRKQLTKNENKSPQNSEQESIMHNVRIIESQEKQILNLTIKTK